MKKKTLSVILSIVLMALAGAVPPATAQPVRDNVHQEEGLALPRDHQYERYDPSNGSYTRVGVDKVANLIRQNVPVYDRTSGAWVYTRNRGVNPAYAAGASTPGKPGWARGSGNWDRASGSWDGNGGWARVNGTVTAINNNKITVREDGGREVIVTMSEARTRLRDGLKVGDRVSVVGIPTGPARLNARAVRERGAAGSVAGGQQADGWQHIHGRVQSVQGNTMTFRTDDGRTLTVDLSAVGPELRQALQQGEGATVIGYDWTGSNQLRAEYVQQDSSDPSRGGSVAPSASPR